MATAVLPTAVKIDPKYESIVPKPSNSDYEKLKQSLDKDGLKKNIEVNKDGYCLDGHSRIRALKELGKEIPPDKIEVIHFDDPLEELEYIWIINSIRRHYEEWQRYEAGKVIKKIEEEKARIRHLSTLKNVKNVSLGSHEPNDQEKGKSSEIAARKVGLSPTTFTRAEYIDSRIPEEVKQKLRENKTKIDTQYKAVRSAEIQRELIKQAASSPLIQLPEGYNYPKVQSLFMVILFKNVE